jgi:hypothetical protein
MPRYDVWSREELVRLLEARDRRDATRFGLVWETNEVEGEKALNGDFVALDLDAALSTAPTAGAEGADAAWRNLIIEGDNFDALRFLRVAYAGRGGDFCLSQAKCLAERHLGPVEMEPLDLTGMPEEDIGEDVIYGEEELADEDERC